MSKIIQNNDCISCFEHYTEDCFPMMIPCGHILCSECITELTRCPLDRQAFEQNQAVQVFNAAEEKSELEKLVDFTDTMKNLMVGKNLKIQKLEEENKKLQKLNKELGESCTKEKEKNEKLNAENEELIAELDIMKIKLENYEKNWSKIGAAYFEVDREIKNGKFDSKK